MHENHRMRELSEADLFDPDDLHLEAESRMNNLMWTVSGDYTLNTKLDLASYRESKHVSMYDAVKQGAFARFFDKDAFALYLVKKLYYGADQQALTALAQLCVDAASYPKIARERPGVAEIRAEAFSWLLEHKFAAYNQTLTGKIRIALMRAFLTGKWDCEGRIRRPLERILALGEEEGSQRPTVSVQQTKGTMRSEQMNDPEPTLEIIRTVDWLYNTLIDPYFEKNHGDLQKVLDTTIEEMQEFDWKDLLEEDAEADLLEQVMKHLNEQVTAMDEETPEEKTPEPEKDEPDRQKKTVVVLDEEAIAKMAHYIELNFGKTYLSEQEEKKLNYRLCRGAHADCRLYYTDGIIENKVLVNAQYVNASRHAKHNQDLFRNSKHLVAANVEVMTSFLKRALLKRTQVERIPDDHGTVIPIRLWRVGRVPDPGKLFYRDTKVRSNDFAVEILMDASGSQRERQGQVALQALIISRALSNAGMPHRIMSFCTFWDYTIMQRFRDFDDPKEADFRVLQYTTSSNNRDGLAIRAAGDALQERSEENKILIVLSDGKPNDVIVNRPGSRNPRPYYGEYGVQDTAFEVRSLRGQGISVLGVFTGTEEDLPAEKKIFGKDFAYVRDIRNFSKVVSGYLQRLLELDAGEL